MIKTKKLDNGIRIATEYIESFQSVSIGIWVKTGAVNEPREMAGISHFIEHMMFKGTEQRTAKQIAEDADKIAGHINAFTGKEATCYYIKTLSSNFGKAADILLDIFLNSKFDKREMVKEKKVICEEMKMIEDMPDEYAHDLLCDAVFKGTSLAKSIIGTPSSLKCITRNKLQGYYEDNYTRDSIVVAIAGNFDEESVYEYFEHKFDKLKAEKPQLTELKAEYSPITKVKVKDIEQSHICLGTKGVKLTDDAYYAFSLINNIMGGSMSSRLFQNIREEKGLAYSVFSVTNSYSNNGYFNIYAGVSHNMIEAAINGIAEEFEKLSKYGVTEEELATAKEQMKGNYIFGQENVSGRMMSMGKNLTILNNIYTTEEIINGLDAVTMDEIRQVADRISNIDNYCAVAITNQKINLNRMLGRG